MLLFDIVCINLLILNIHSYVIFPMKCEQNALHQQFSKKTHALCNMYSNIITKI